jgi:peptide/nickel transport system ATP-binding protein
MAETILSIENLAVEFETSLGRVPALHGVSFGLRLGEILGIVGESGSGKTVACRSILRLLPNTARTLSGRILFENRDVLSLAQRDLSGIRGEKIAMIFQDPSTHLDPVMRVGKQIGEALTVHFGIESGQARKRSIELLDDVSIRDPERCVDAFPHELSGGMRQRVMIAAALACEPKILIADEPTTALDVTVQDQILVLLKQLREKRNLSIILVSHDLGIIGQTCNRIVVMKDGRIVEAGLTSEIVNHPGAEYTKKLIDSQPELLLNRRNSDSAGPSKNSGLEIRSAEPPILEIQNLSVFFKKSPGLIEWLRQREGHVVKAVDGISMRIRRGDSLGIVGESGSGKSTIARAIVRLIDLESGKILYKGEDVSNERGRSLRPFRRSVQMVFQDPYTSLNPRLTITKTLAEPLRKHNICEPAAISDRIQKLLKDVELPENLMQRHSTQLSGGQRQRVGIARALSLNPEVIIADEVTSALDVTIQAQILELFRKLRERRHLTLVFISHDLSVVRNICETVLVMKHGKMVEYGPTEQIFNAPKESYTRELLSAIPKVLHV